MFKGNTDSGNTKIFRSKLLFTKQNATVNLWQTKFCAALALTVVGSDDDFWINDNECLDHCDVTIEDLAAYWRTTLLEKDGKILGLGLLDEQNASGTEMSESRNALYRYLKILGEQYEKANLDTEVKFNIKL